MRNIFGSIRKNDISQVGAIFCFAHSCFFQNIFNNLSQNSGVMASISLQMLFYNWGMVFGLLTYPIFF